MNTFHVQTLGCKVNQYESEQIATLLRARGWRETSAEQASLRIINTCSVTVQAASQSRQAARRATRLPVLAHDQKSGAHAPAKIANSLSTVTEKDPSNILPGSIHRPRVVVTGCWATSDAPMARSIDGVDAVLTHHDDLAADLDQLLYIWRLDDGQCPPDTAELRPNHAGPRAALPPGSMDSDGWIRAGTAGGERTNDSKPETSPIVNEDLAAGYRKVRRISLPVGEARSGPLLVRESRLAGGLALPAGAITLPLLSDHQTTRQRAFLKIQDGCDAHCTYCIIPRLRPRLWSKPIEDAVDEAQRLVDAGHVEIVLTGIFLGAYGQPTALRRRQPIRTGAPLAELVESLCTKVRGLRRLRLSSLEPGDLSDDLLRALSCFPQVVPHFHLPLQSGSDAILRRMNRQYRSDDFRRMVARVSSVFDRPALTTDVIVGFPGETPDDFDKTLGLVREAGFIHVHAFPYSPRPDTAAARWTDDFVRGPLVNQGIDLLRDVAAEQSLTFRGQFIGREVEVIVEHGPSDAPLRHGRCDRYFTVHFESNAQAGAIARVRIDSISGERTLGTAIC